MSLKYHQCYCSILSYRIYRGVAYFCFGKGEWQQFQLQFSQASIKCYITLQDEQPIGDELTLLLEQRRELLVCLESFISEIIKACMPSARAPVTCLQCPLCDKDCAPHVMLNIHQRHTLICYQKRPKATKIPPEHYGLLFVPSITPHEGMLICRQVMYSTMHIYM